MVGVERLNKLQRKTAAKSGRRADSSDRTSAFPGLPNHSGAKREKISPHGSDRIPEDRRELQHRTGVNGGRTVKFEERDGRSPPELTGNSLKMLDKRTQTFRPEEDEERGKNGKNRMRIRPPAGPDRRETFFWGFFHACFCLDPLTKPRPFFPPGKEPFLSQYRCGALLGSGGFGSVFSGQRLSDGLQVRLHPFTCALETPRIVSPAD